MSRRSAPSQRQLRVGEVIRHALAEALQRGDVADPELEGVSVTVPEVRMSPDLRRAVAHVVPLGGHSGTDVAAALSRHRRFLRGVLARRVELKYMPELEFAHDSRFEEARRIEDILRSPEVARDLGEDGE